MKEGRGQKVREEQVETLGEWDKRYRKKGWEVGEDCMGIDWKRMNHRVTGKGRRFYFVYLFYSYTY